MGTCVIWLFAYRSSASLLNEISTWPTNSRLHYQRVTIKHVLSIEGGTAVYALVRSKQQAGLHGEASRHTSGTYLQAQIVPLFQTGLPEHLVLLLFNLLEAEDVAVASFDLTEQAVAAVAPLQCPEGTACVQLRTTVDVREHIVGRDCELRDIRMDLHSLVGGPLTRRDIGGR